MIIIDVNNNAIVIFECVNDIAETLQSFHASLLTPTYNFSVLMIQSPCDNYMCIPKHLFFSLTTQSRHDF